MLTIGTRGSALALAQTELVRRALLAAQPGLEVAVRTITTRGDVVLDRPLAAIGGKGLFVVEIEAALRRGEIDLAVHSAKDLPARLPADLLLAAFPERADPRDALVTRSGARLAELPPGARVGTSSLRRACQLRRLRPDLVYLELRGNVDTRLRKLRAGQYDAIVLAAAGLARLGRLDEATEILDPADVLPAPGQGALALETRADDPATRRLVAPLDHGPTRLAVTAERAFLARIEAGCDVPVAAWARQEGEALALSGLIGARDGRTVRAERRLAGAASERAAAALGADLADDLLRAGGAELLAAARSATHV